VYISLVIVIGALVYLAIAAYKTYKETKPAMKQLQDTTTRMQAEMIRVKDETDQLTAKQQEITDDMQYKKQAVMYTVESAKEASQSIKQIWEVVKSEKHSVNSIRSKQDA
jgi:uncharacterized protein YoxC